MTALCAGAFACDGSSEPGSSGPAERPCNPLTTTEQPVELATILGVGRDAGGTLYVVDRVDSTFRVFTTVGQVLARREVSGSGFNPGPPETIDLRCTDERGVFALGIERSAAGATRMGFFRGELATKGLAIGAQGDVLEVLAPSAIAGYAVRNVAGDVEIAYDATAPDGRRILVTHPKVDAKVTDYRVFFGSPPSMIERRLISFQPGGSSYVTFDDGGVERTAVFPSGPNTSSGRAPRLIDAQGTVPLSPGSRDPGPPGALSFLCF